MDKAIIPTQHHTAKMVLVVLGLVVAGLLIWIWFAQRELANTPAVEIIDNTPVYKPPYAVERTDIAQANLPDGLPKDLPIESGAEVVSNYTAKSGIGLSQATRVYTSSRSFSDLEQEYRTYFTEKGWQLDPTFKSESNWGITARTGTDMINISLSSIAGNDKILVNLTYMPGAERSAQ